MVKHHSKGERNKCKSNKVERRVNQKETLEEEKIQCKDSDSNILNESNDSSCLLSSVLNQPGLIHFRPWLTRVEYTKLYDKTLTLYLIAL